MGIIWTWSERVCAMARTSCRKSLQVSCWLYNSLYSRSAELQGVWLAMYGALHCWGAKVESKRFLIVALVDCSPQGNAQSPSVGTWYMYWMYCTSLSETFGKDIQMIQMSSSVCTSQINKNDLNFTSDADAPHHGLVAAPMARCYRNVWVAWLAGTCVSISFNCSPILLHFVFCWMHLFCKRAARFCQVVLHWKPSTKFLAPSMWEAQAAQARHGLSRPHGSTPFQLNQWHVQ